MNQASRTPVDCQAISLSPPADISVADRRARRRSARSYTAASRRRRTPRLAAAPPTRSAPACWPARPRRRSCERAASNARSQPPSGVPHSASLRQRRTRAMDEQLAQVFVAAFGDAQEARLAAGRHLAWHQPEPSRKIASTGEGFSRYQSRPPTRLHSARRCRGSSPVAAHRQFPREGGELLVKGGDAPIELDPFRAHVVDQLPHPRTKR